MKERDSIEVAAEDRYAVFDMSSPDSLFPHPFHFGNLALAVSACSKRWQPLWDFRKAGTQLYRDILDAYAEMDLALEDRHMIASTCNIECAREAAARFGSKVVEMKDKFLPTQSLNMTAFAEDFEFMADWGALMGDGEAAGGDIRGLADLGFIDQEDKTEVKEYREYRKLVDEDFSQAISDSILDKEWNFISGCRRDHLATFLNKIATNSLLAEMAMFEVGGEIKVVPYHSHSIHAVERLHSDNAVFLQPARVDYQNWENFRKQIRQLEHLLNKPNVNEREIETLLRSNPLFLRGLNYREAYFQVELPREGKSSLIPDVFAKPADSDWWDIIDFKLPHVPILIGRENRTSLSHAIHQVAAQLREYGAYFEEERRRKAISELYGVKCYKPRLIAIVGRDPAAFSSVEHRRALTAYPDLEVVTYDQLLRAAKTVSLLL